jgi:hypothetical protein
LELRGLEGSKFYVTFDDIHGNLINTLLTNKKKKFLCLPNATNGDQYEKKTNLLHRKLRIPVDNKILLHSGGFGPWFSSVKLAKYSVELPSDYELVFHTGYDLSSDQYYKNYIEKRGVDDRSIFSMAPLEFDGLDALVSSARIGIAWYEVQVLDKRAIMMGLAAGKIGQYLKCGIPVICPTIKSLNYIDQFQCGVMIEKIEESHSAIEKIENNYDHYRNNAFNCYNQLWKIDSYINNIINNINS